ncbi:MAG: hypothetical protein JJW01_02595 [Alphaproteobacteria bacterium]|nr:hypothetical protein [Rickettsiales bacterium]
MSGSIKVGENQIATPNEMIESGLYFKDALLWYRDHYLSPIGASIVYIIFFLVHLVIIGMVIAFIPRMLPLKEKVSMVLEKNRPAATFLSVKPLARYKEPSYSIMLLLVENYVLQRETYKLQNNESPESVMHKKKRFVETTSSKSVARAFDRWVGSYNSITGNFLMSDIETNVTIISSELKMSKRTIMRSLVSHFVPKEQPNSAIVYFRSINSNGEEKRFRAEIKFEFRLPKARGKGELFFKVIHHSVSKI